jgi:hypothetical protein
MSDIEKVPGVVKAKEVVVDDLPYKQGERFTTDRANFEKLKRRDLVAERPKLPFTARTLGTIPPHSLEVGKEYDDVPAGMENVAMDYYRAGRIDIREEDARSAGVELPRRRADPAEGTVKVGEPPLVFFRVRSAGAIGDHVTLLPEDRAREAEMNLGDHIIRDRVRVKLEDETIVDIEPAAAMPLVRQNRAQLVAIDAPLSPPPVKKSRGA